MRTYRGVAARWPSRLVAVLVPRSVLYRLDTVARERRVTRSSLIRVAVVAWLRQVDDQSGSRSGNVSSPAPACTMHTVPESGHSTISEMCPTSKYGHK